MAVCVCVCKWTGDNDLSFVKHKQRGSDPYQRVSVSGEVNGPLEDTGLTILKSHLSDEI